MRYIVFLVGFAALLNSCVDTSSKESNTEQDYLKFQERFLTAYWQQHPGWAASLGLHQYDSILSIPTPAFRAAEVAFCKQYLDSLSGFDTTKLSSSSLTDYWMVRDQLQATIWNVEVFKEYEWNPSSYNVAGAFAEILNGKYAPLDDRLRAISIKLNGVEDYYVAAKANLNKPTVEHTELAIQQNRGGMDVFGPAMIDSVYDSGLSDVEEENILIGIELAREAIEDYANHLEQTVLPQAKANPRDFRIGKELFAQKFKHDIQSSLAASEVYAMALDAKKQLHKDMYVAAQSMWATYFPKKILPADSLTAIRAMVQRLSLVHVHRDSFQTAIEHQIPQLTAFVKEHDILDLDPSKPLVVRKEPAYMAGVAGASISSPGPFETNGQTFYNVGSLEHYTDTEAESYLREYNNYILQVLNIHEAIPGHYAQLVYANKTPSKVKSVFGNGAMIEGWAVYTEKMMLEQGYGATAKSAPNTTPEMAFMYSKWNLRVVCNTILDYGIHVNDMTEQQGLDLLMNQAFQQEAEAKGKWRRATLSQVQLCSYFTGFREIMLLREEVKQSEGKAFSLKAFHEEFLSFGSAPVQYVRKLMLGKPKIAA